MNVVFRRPTQQELQDHIQSAFSPVGENDPIAELTAAQRTALSMRYPLLTVGDTLAECGCLPDLRIQIDDPADLIVSTSLKVMEGEVLLLSIRTVHKDPDTQDVHDGVAIARGNSVAMVSVPNLDRLYHTWIETTRYGVEVVYVPVDTSDLVELVTFSPRAPMEN